jgi:hypothetical protein
MKALPIQNSSRRLLCDDSDYDLLAPYKWKFHYGVDILIVRAYLPGVGAHCTPLRLMSYENYKVSKKLFRDGNIANYQRSNLNLEKALPNSSLTPRLEAPHCLHGPAILVASIQVGRAKICQICASETVDFYLQCLDIVAHKSYWKGWIRYEAYRFSGLSNEEIRQLPRDLTST